jgi:hypothetical protein
MNANPIWKTLESFERILSPTINNERLHIVHEQGLVHLEEDLKEIEKENSNLRYEIKRLRDKVENLLDFTAQLTEENRKLKEHNGSLPFDPEQCCFRFGRKFSKDEAWRGWTDYFCIHEDNFYHECDAADYSMYPLVSVECPRVKAWLEEKGE